MESEYSQICNLIKEYGDDVTLGQIKKIIIGRNHVCPNCNGRGYILEEYIVCNLCNGHGFTDGFTDAEYQLRRIQDGWAKV